MTEPLCLTPGGLSLDVLRRIHREAPPLTLDPRSYAAMAASQAVVAAIAGGESAVYGINTGFGKLAHKRIAPADLEALQTNLILSHATGMGAPIADATVRLILAIKAASLAVGASGIRAEIVDALLALANADVLPVIPSKGSVGASGDLAPLAHLCCALLGIGSVRHKGAVLPAGEGLAIAGLSPITLRAKEGLALINGTQVSTALALAGLFEIERAFAAAILAGALSVEAVMGSHRPFDPRISALRGQFGQIDVAALFRLLLDGSPLNAAHQGPSCERVQDPYSLRCQPQVMGAVLDQMRFAARTLTIEANGVTDNPLVLVDTGEVLSGGNFHAEPVAMAADQLAIAASEIGALSERRIAMLIDSTISGLPPFLVAEPGLNSGFMIAHVTAAALASENKSLAHPASVDSLPTSANQEDHVSMATFAARRLGDIAANVTGIVGIELLAAAQGLEFHRPLRSSQTLETAMAMIRERVPSYRVDRYFAPDLEAIAHLIGEGRFDALVPVDLSTLGSV
ncbi:histidine ammonia-lyase [Rhodospirillum rubrum]|uniref:Histidine ammonia-lyase n=1 Tax=Rhodospirillum rubrum (strain ATCC 11170 / ATH 1.1.1 / DSM 467 / LMG 4362 / NCIMB 8255 / S1) TaxID=269796 RepID=HUTH_RHORT|nr:histidine ammonia-lyase [Rhodospirillum rubrum]Q2RUU3.1 RecName: Full=Histidine ammonia-lyase; Short=Histidase [Rhodospirillum rubrum ATCC 11170]ABC22102.1 histidine ammonia-lyase [Rhodospirillum rubrum ATCC 11170]AEO47816.1 histidine ammonia-lyase [Rhodospirillum rubrum F11]MBK5953692.1 histidine ammonia-lyase [Rhodospirillum rubrum]QXG81752.1 histidine ammonia-lyase [Rhodospirillum rubrum]HAQ00356.1 histidine ammonia-lyase [Rhodospirillum rubrum]